MEWFRANGKVLSIGATVVAAGAVLWVAYVRFQNSRTERADRELAIARGSYTSGNLPLAQSDLRKVLDRYKGTDAGTQAGLLLAQAFFDDGKVDEGVKVLDGLPTSGELGAAVEALRGAGLELKGKPAEAAQHYQTAASAARSAADRDAYRADAARAFAAAGKNAEAVAIWTELSKDASSYYAAEAHVRIGELTAKAAK